MKLLCLDFETYYDQDYSLSKKRMSMEKYIRNKKFKAHGCGIKTSSGKNVWVTGSKLQATFDKINWNDVALLAHNAQFDSAILAWHYGKVPGLYIDTLGMARALLGPAITRHGLKYVAQYLCQMTKRSGLDQSKGVRDLSPSQENILSWYCAGGSDTTPNADGYREASDLDLTWAIFQKMKQHFPPKELRSLDWVVRTYTQPLLRLDAKLLRTHYHEVMARKKQTLEDAGLADRKLLMSNPKFAAALEELGVTPPTKINKAGQVKFAFAKTDAGLQALRNDPDERVQALVEARLANKSTIEETRTITFWDASRRGAWPACYNYSGAISTHRMSGSDGSNAQNLPRGGALRKSIYAPKGYTLGVADLSQIECRGTLWFGMQMVGEGSEEHESLKLMAGGGDIYSYFGSKIYGVPINKKDNPKERQISKSAVLGLGYSMGYNRFTDYCHQQHIEMDEQMAQNIVALYRSTYVGVKKFWRYCQQVVSGLVDQDAEGYIPNQQLPVLYAGQEPLTGAPGLRAPSGLWIKYPNLRRGPEGDLLYDSRGVETKLFGGKIAQNIMECVTSELLKDAVIEVHKIYKVVMVTHDELVAVVPEGEEENFGALVNRVMAKPSIHMPGLPVGLEWGCAKRYGEAKT